VGGEQREAVIPVALASLVGPMAEAEGAHGIMTVWRDLVVVELVVSLE